MLHWLARFHRLPRTKRTDAGRRSAPPTVEQLDERCLLNAAMLPGHVMQFATHLAPGVTARFASLDVDRRLDQDDSVVGQLANARSVTATTVAPNGDQNPYGVAFVPDGFEGGGKLRPGDLLVSDFNNSTADGNVQGTGTSIVRITPGGKSSLFFQDSSLPGLTTALGVLKSGFVLVGNVPNVNGVAQPGGLTIINSQGKFVETLTDPVKLDGPWDLTVVDHGDRALVFVSNVLNGTVTRIDLRIPDGGVPVVTGMTTIASGYGTATSMTAFVLGPTGLAFDAKTDTLYVASTDDNAIFAVANAAFTRTDHGTGRVVVPSTDAHLHGPLGLVLAPNGDLIVSNGDASHAGTDVNEIVEYTPRGKFVTEMPVDNSGTPGGAFGIALTESDGKVRFAAVDDNFNTATVWSLPEGFGDRR